MEAQELRLGNLFIDDISKKLIKVLELKKDEITFTGKFTDEWQAKPILLTEEWLLSFGFKLNENEVYQIESTLYPLSITINVVFQWCAWLNIDMKYYVISEDIKYVHQLQNLYFALTNKELVWSSLKR